MFKYSDMHKYQSERMVPWIINNKFCALWAEPGLGKTVATLTAIKQLRADFEIDRTLVVAPLLVSQSVWPKEIKKWEHLQDMTCVNLYWPDAEENKCAYAKINKEGLQQNDRDSGKERIRKLKRRDEIIYAFYLPWLGEHLSKRATIYTINREQIHLLCRVLYLDWGFDNVILDEASSFKNQTSLRWKGLKTVRPKIHRLVELTGTPASNGLEDLWAQIWLIDKGESLYRNITAFRDVFFTPGHNGFGYDLKPGSKERIYEKVEHLCLTMLADDYLELPEWLPVLVPLKLPTKAQAMYDELEREFLLTVEGETVSAVHAAALQNKLRQICNGAVYTDNTFDDPEKDSPPLKKNWKVIHDVKIEALRSIYEEAAGEPVLVAYNFRHDLARIQKAFPEARVINTPQAEDDWNAGKIRLGLGHPASMGHGLNLQYGGHIGVWFGYTWDTELYEQFNKRLDRQGQTKPVITHHLYIDCVTENVMRESLLEDQLTQRELLVRMKKGIENEFR